MSYDPYESLRRMRQVADESIGQLAPVPVQAPIEIEEPKINMGPYAPQVGAPSSGLDIGKIIKGMPMFQPQGVSAQPGPAAPLNPTGGNWVPLYGQWKADPGLAAAYQQAMQYAGTQIKLNSAGRTNAEQQHLYRTKPGLAAKPGHSLHEKGLAIDVDNWRDPKVKAALERAGFRQFDPKKEPWHFSYGPKVG